MTVFLIIMAKTIFLALCTFAHSRWKAYRQTRPIPLRFDEKQGAYIAHDWTATAERFRVGTGKALLTAVVAWWAIVALLMFVLPSSAGERVMGAVYSIFI